MSLSRTVYCWLYQSNTFEIISEMEINFATFIGKTHCRPCDNSIFTVDDVYDGFQIIMVPLVMQRYFATS